MRAEFCRSRLGVLEHDERSWPATLELSGNPNERIFARQSSSLGDDEGGVAAYLRTTDLYGDHQFLGMGASRRRSRESQVEMFLQAVRGSGRDSALLAAIDDQELFDRLRQRGCVVEREEQATWLLRSLDRAAPELEQRLPSRRFEFFMSDRF